MVVVCGGLVVVVCDGWVLCFLERCMCVSDMGWLRLEGSLKIQVSFAKEPYKRDDILHSYVTIVVCIV